MVAISAMFIWKPPSPEMAHTVPLGRARCTPIAAGTANPIAPRPPDVMCELGCWYGYSLATHIWCWPTSVTMVQSRSEERRVGKEGKDPGAGRQTRGAHER